MWVISFCYVWVSVLLVVVFVLVGVIVLLFDGFSGVVVMCCSKLVLVVWKNSVVSRLYRFVWVRFLVLLVGVVVGWNCRGWVFVMGLGIGFNVWF